MNRYQDALLVALGVALLAATTVLPSWALTLVAISLAKGLVALGLLLLMRAGLVPFGHAMYFCIGGYAAGLGVLWLGVRDALLLLALAVADPGPGDGRCRLSIDLPAQCVRTADGRQWSFGIDSFRKTNLLQGNDAIALTLQQAGAIAQFEQRHFQQQPWLAAPTPRF